MFLTLTVTQTDETRFRLRLRLRPEDSSRGSIKGESREGQVKTPVEGRTKKTPERVK
jgi:hypothetical protein